MKARTDYAGTKVAAALAFAAFLVLPTMALAQTNDVLLGVFRFGMKALQNKPAAPQEPTAAAASDAQRKALEAQIDEALKNEPEDVRARKKAELLAQFERSTQQANAVARHVDAAEARQAQSGVDLGEAVEAATRSSPTGALRQAQSMSQDPSRRAQASRVLDAAARPEAADRERAEPGLLGNFLQRMKDQPRRDGEKPGGAAP